MNPKYDMQYIDDPGALEAFCRRLSGAGWIALDTEFLREKTYYPQLCLVQIAIPDTVACIDALALADLAPLLDVIFDTSVTKVMHAARQDMEIFYHLRGEPPAPVFDTQVAALLLGYPDQIGYANLVREVLGVALDKLHTRADWSQRPLSPQQMKYAADDVVYLVQIYQSMTRRLAELGRLDWLAEDFVQLSNPDLYSAHPEAAWLRVKGANRLKGAALAVLQALAGWREALAQEKDRPRGWLLRDDVMVDIARHKPITLAALGKIRGVSEGLLNRDGRRLLDLIATAVQQPPAPLPRTTAPPRLNASQDALVDVLTAVVRMSGTANSLNPAVLAGRKDLERLVAGNGDCAVLHGWRRSLVGNQLQALLDGELSLSVRDGKLAFQAVHSADTGI
jgi:ribonuclease D